MIKFEYKVIPAPLRGLKGKGVKGADGRFANVLEAAMNDMAAQGWEYQRAETLPSEERSGLTSKTTVFRNVLIFRRALESDVDAVDPVLEFAPEQDKTDPDVIEDAQETQALDSAEQEISDPENPEDPEDPEDNKPS